MHTEMAAIKTYVREKVVTDGRRTKRQMDEGFMAGVGERLFVGGENAGPADIYFYEMDTLHYVGDIGPGRAVKEDVDLKPWMDCVIALLPAPAPKVLPMSAFGPAIDGRTGGRLLESPQFDPIKK